MSAKKGSEFPPVASMSFEAALKELEDSISLYERGQELKRHCEAKLKTAESRLEKIVVGAKGPEGVVPADQD